MTPAAGSRGPHGFCPIPGTEAHHPLPLRALPLEPSRHAGRKPKLQGSHKRGQTQLSQSLGHPGDGHGPACSRLGHQSLASSRPRPRLRPWASWSRDQAVPWLLSKVSTSRLQEDQGVGGVGVAFCTHKPLICISYPHPLTSRPPGLRLPNRHHRSCPLILIWLNQK